MRFVRTTRGVRLKLERKVMREAAQKVFRFRGDFFFFSKEIYK